MWKTITNEATIPRSDSAIRRKADADQNSFSSQRLG